MKTEVIDTFLSRHPQVISAGKKLLYRLALSDGAHCFKLRLVGGSQDYLDFFFLFLFPAYLLFWVFTWMKLSTVKVILPSKCSTAISLPQVTENKIYYLESKMTQAIYPEVTTH